MEEFCVRPLTAAPIRRLLPTGYGLSLKVTGVFDFVDQPEDHGNNRMVTVPYDPVAGRGGDGSGQPLDIQFVDCLVPTGAAK